MSKVRNIACAMAAVLLMAACNNADTPSKPIDHDTAAKYESELKPNLDLSTVLVARLDVNGEQLEITSLFPMVLPTTTSPETGAARTWFWFDPDKQFLRLMTRTQNGDNSFAEIKVDDLKPGMTVSLPVARPGGETPSGIITFHEILKKP